MQPFQQTLINGIKPSQARCKLMKRQLELLKEGGKCFHSDLGFTLSYYMSGLHEAKIHYVLIRSLDGYTLDTTQETLARVTNPYPIPKPLA